jgi:GxxExxY protein
MVTEEKSKYLFQDLTEKLIGYAFDIFKQIGPGFPEKTYQKAFENKLKDHELIYRRVEYCKVMVDGKRVGSFMLDFLVDNKIIVEFKVRNIIMNQDIAQVLTYMKMNKIRIGLIMLFTNKKVCVKRLIN